MKISESAVHLSSFHSEEEIFEERSSSRQNMTRRPRLSMGRWGNRAVTVLDRVTLSSRSHRMQSEYSADLKSTSTVTDGDRVETFEDSEMVSRILGSVMDRDVVVRTLDGDDIPAGDQGPSAPPAGREVSSGGTRFTLTRSRTRFEQEQMGFSSRGTVTTEDGRTIEFALDLNMDRALLSRTEEQTLIQTFERQAKLIDPLVISLDGSPPQLTDTRFEFDLDNDGDMEHISFAAKGSGFLSFDRNNDGKINNGSELFGPGTGNGFGELAELDGDGNGWIDENDEVFSKLSVWTRDEAGNDILVSLKEAGVGAVYLDNAQSEFSMTTMDDRLKGQVRRSGVFLFENGNVGAIQQIDLADQSGEPANRLELKASGNVRAMTSESIRTRPLRQPRAVSVLPEAPSEHPLKALIDEIKSLRAEIQDIIGKSRDKRQRFGDRRSRAMSFPGRYMQLDLIGRTPLSRQI